MSKRKDTGTFIKDAQTVHRDKYDYSQVVYVSNKKKVVIICRVHGQFLQTPNSHLRQHGCSVCANNQCKSAATFISEARKVHGSLYDYSKVDYNGAHKKVIIICKVHGQFVQNPISHLYKRGCPSCAINLPKTTDNFIIAARKVHGNTYDYSKVNYIGNKKKVIIICKVHGQFLQTPNSHLRPRGCPICKCSKGEKLVAQLLDNLNVKYKREFSFPDLLGNVYTLKFDFALFKNNKLFCLIEYDGELHFRYVKGLHKGEKIFKLQKRYDKLKNEYCKKNNIKLIRVSYKCKDIESYLKEHLN